MQTVGTEDFIRNLRQQHCYRTDPTRLPSPIQALPGARSLLYHARIWRAVLSASLAAARNTYDRNRWTYDSLTMLRIVESCGGVITVEGLQNIAQNSRPVVFISNHMSTVETFLLPVILLPFRDIAFVIKESLLRYPFFGRVMRSVGHVAVTRKDPKEDLRRVLRDGRAQLERGRSVIVFPQATRSVEFTPSDFNTLGIKLAKEGNVPIVPTALKTDFLQNGRVFKDMGPIDPRRKLHFRFGEQRTVEGKGRIEHERVVRFIAESLAEWKSQDEL